MRRIAAPPSPAMPTTAMPATSAPPNPESDGGSCSGAVRSEYVGSGVGDAAAIPDGEVVGVGVTGGADVGDVEGREEDSEAAGAGVDDADGAGTAASVAVSPDAGACVFSGVRVASGVRVGLGEGFGDFVGVGVGAGSAMTSAHPRAG